MSSRRGFTLIETAIAVVLVSLLCLIGFPKVRAGMARNDVRASRTMLVNLLAKARASATLSNRRTWLKVSGNRVVILARPRLNVGLGTADTLGVVEDINRRYGTTITGFDNDSIAFDPRGFGYNWPVGSYSIKVTKSGYRDSVIVDMKGRIRK